MDNRPAPNAPIATFRDGRLKTSVFENHGENGPYHTVTVAKTYEDKNGRLQDSHSFTGGELLRVSELLRESHGFLRDLRRERALEQKKSPAQSKDVPERFRGMEPGR